MILTGVEIEREWTEGRIIIDPFAPDQVNPNSYNFRLGSTLRVYRSEVLDPRLPNDFDEFQIPEDGYVLEPGRLYLGHTVETLGGEHYAPTFAARSSVARLGLFINLSASLGDIGYVGQWTLQLYTMNRVRVYPGMNIGQMMWWNPRGRINLYDGKYQGAMGPRTSDLHVDFALQRARQQFPGLASTVDPEDVGPKFAQLARSSQDFDVPTAFCVPAAVFESALGDEDSEALRLAFVDLKATVGAFFTDSMARLHAIGERIQIPDQVRELLGIRLEDMFGATDTVELAVRSSGLDEDNQRSSLAGIHSTLLGVRGIEAVISAIEQCWRSYYEAPAVAARVRVGNFDPRPRLAVIVQALVRPRLAGVAVTHTEGAGPSSVTIEYVEGLADRLVAGVAAPACASSESLERDANPSPDRGERDILARVVRIARDLRASRGFDVDVEWAADEHGVHLVQVRPLTASLRERREDTGSHFEPYRLYLDTPPPSFHWGDIADVYGGYVAKRAPAYQLASDLGVPTGPGWVISFNGLGLREPSTVSWLTEALHAHSSECVVDFGNNLRQIVVSTEALLDTLAVTTGADPDSGTLRTAVVRAFIRGQLGVISRLVNDSLLIEYTDQGLMALNRGTAGAQTILVADSAYPSRWASPDDPAGAALSAHVASIARLTRAMHRVHGPVALEWVMDDNRPYFVDYSRLGGSDALRVSQQQTQCISRGTARGPLLRVSDDDLLHRLSIGPAVSINKSLDVAEHEGLAAIIERVASHRERPIISVSRPYAVLSVLIEHVAGFVFDEGSILGHLAILLREAGVPAAIAPGITATTAVISNGTVTTIGDGADE